MDSSPQKPKFALHSIEDAVSQTPGVNCEGTPGIWKTTGGERSSILAETNERSVFSTASMPHNIPKAEAPVSRSKKERTLIVD